MNPNDQLGLILALLSMREQMPKTTDPGRFPYSDPSVEGTGVSRSALQQREEQLSRRNEGSWQEFPGLAWSTPMYEAARLQGGYDPKLALMELLLARVPDRMRVGIPGKDPQGRLMNTVISSDSPFIRGK